MCGVLSFRTKCIIEIDLNGPKDIFLEHHTLFDVCTWASEHQMIVGEPKPKSSFFSIKHYDDAPLTAEEESILKGWASKDAHLKRAKRQANKKNYEKNTKIALDILGLTPSKNDLEGSTHPYFGTLIY